MNIKKLGILFLLYNILLVGIVGFIIIFGFSLAIGDSAILSAGAKLYTVS